MSFQNFNLNNNARAPLFSAISASSTSIVVNAWYWALFPTTNFLITIESLDTTVIPNVVTKREIIKVVSRSWDTFNITGWRWYGTCPPSDASVTPWNTAFAFGVLDRISGYITAEYESDIKTEVVRLWTVKQEAIWGFWKSLYRDATGWLIELIFWAAWTVFTSNWASAAPTWTSPTVNISGLTNDATDPTTNDYMFWFRNWTWNVKRLLAATTSFIWMIRQSTDAEVIAWTNTTTCPSPKQINDNYWLNAMAWTTFITWQSLGSVTTNSSSYAKVKEIVIKTAWTYTVYYMWAWNSWVSTWTFNVYKNWVVMDVWYEHSNWATVAVWYSQDSVFAAWDLVQIYAKTSNTSFSATVSTFKISFDIQLHKYISTVNI